MLGFSVQAHRRDGAGASRRTRTRSSNAEPVGAFVNDNVMVTTAAYVAEDAEAAVRDIVASNPTYLQSNVFRYHDTFPHPDWVPNWPELLPEMTDERPDASLGSAGHGARRPRPRAGGSARRWESAGADQLVFGIGPGTLEGTLETIRLMGEHVIPKIDTDPVHRTTRFRDAAAASSSSARYAPSAATGTSTMRERTYSPSPFACGSKRTDEATPSPSRPFTTKLSAWRFGSS